MKYNQLLLLLEVTTHVMSSYVMYLPLSCQLRESLSGDDSSHPAKYNEGLCGRISFTISLTNSCPGLVVNAPPSGAPLESGQRGWGFDSRHGRLWSLEPGFWTGPTNFFCISFFLIGIRFLALIYFFLSNQLAMIRCSKPRKKELINEKRC